MPRILEREGALSEIKKGNVLSSFVCLASTIAECGYCYRKLLQTEALCPLHLLPVARNVLQLILFLSKATQKGSGIKEAARSHTVFQKKAVYKPASVENAAKKNKKHFLRISRGIDPILSKTQNYWKEALCPDQVRNLRRERG